MDLNDEESLKNTPMCKKEGTTESKCVFSPECEIEESVSKVKVEKVASHDDGAKETVPAVKVEESTSVGKVELVSTGGSGKNAVESTSVVRTMFKTENDVDMSASVGTSEINLGNKSAFRPCEVEKGTFESPNVFIPMCKMEKSDADSCVFSISCETGAESNISESSFKIKKSSGGSLHTSMCETGKKSVKRTGIVSEPVFSSIKPEKPPEDYRNDLALPLSQESDPIGDLEAMPAHEKCTKFLKSSFIPIGKMNEDYVESEVPVSLCKTEILDESEPPSDEMHESSNESTVLFTPSCELDENSIDDELASKSETSDTEIEEDIEFISPCKEEEEGASQLPPASKVIYRCKTCQEQCAGIDSFAQHMCTHPGEKPYKCNLCPERFFRARACYRHRLTRAGGKTALDLSLEERAQQAGRAKRLAVGGLHKCDRCGKQFAHRATLLFHLKTHLGEEPHHCEACGKRFARKNDLSRHWLTHSGEKKYQCEKCHKQFSTKSNLSQHLLIHSEVKTYQCEICSKMFAQKTGLLKHVPVHSEKNFQCEVCKKQFSLRSTLTKHMLTHAEVKPFQCELCFKRFALKSTFSGHLLTHTGERHYPCELCPKRFARRSHLARHMLTHTGEKPHKCEVCFKKFAQKSDITQHMLTHTGEKPHQCPFCVKKYSKKSHLTHHVVNHHAEEMVHPKPMLVGCYPYPINRPSFHELQSIQVQINDPCLFPTFEEVRRPMNVLPDAPCPSPVSPTFSERRSKMLFTQAYPIPPCSSPVSPTFDENPAQMSIDHGISVESYPSPVPESRASEEYEVILAP